MTLSLNAPTRDRERRAPAATSTKTAASSVRPPPLPSAAVAKKLPGVAPSAAATEREWEALRQRARSAEEREWQLLRARVRAAEEREWQELRLRAHAAEQQRLPESPAVGPLADRPVAHAQQVQPPERGRVVSWP